MKTYESLFLKILRNISRLEVKKNIDILNTLTNTGILLK